MKKVSKKITEEFKYEGERYYRTDDNGKITWKIPSINFDLFDLFGDDDNWEKEDKVFLTEEECEGWYQKLLREEKLKRILK